MDETKIPAGLYCETAEHACPYLQQGTVPVCLLCAAPVKSDQKNKICFLNMEV